MGLFSGILKTVDPIGGAIIGKLTKKPKKAKAATAAKAGTAPEQTTEQQLANLNNQIAADQQGLAQASQSQKTWQYVAIGVGAVVVIGGAIYFLAPRGKK